MTWPRRLVASILGRDVFDSRKIRVGFVADDVTLEQVILPVLRCPNGNIPAAFLTHITFINTVFK